eukprot:jgi/Psemu1/33331/gm1.33331_g
MNEIIAKANEILSYLLAAATNILPSSPPPVSSTILKKQNTTFCPDALDKECLICIIKDFSNTANISNLNLYNDVKHRKTYDFPGGNLKHSWDAIVQKASPAIKDAGYSKNIHTFLRLAPVNTTATARSTKTTTVAIQTHRASTTALTAMDSPYHHLTIFQTLPLDLKAFGPAITTVIARPSPGRGSGSSQHIRAGCKNHSKAMMHYQPDRGI